MSCCGSRRAALRQTTRPAESRSTAVAYNSRTLEFEYNGSGQMQIVGPMTGTVYTFNGPGSRAVVQAADAPSIAMNQTLRPLR
jgi:hypothetical protein